MENWNVSEIMQLVSEVLGADANAVLINDCEIDEDCARDIYTNLEKEMSIKEFCSDYMIKRGITKIVIIPTKGDYVIKIPFTGVYGFSGEEDGEVESKPYLITNTDFDEYDVFDIEKRTYDSLFQESKVAFLPNYLVGNYNGIPIYIQEKIKVTASHFFYDISYNEKSAIVAKVKTESKYTEENVDTTPLKDYFIADLIKFYGEEATKLILADCRDIDDLHGNNYGYTYDGRPVIFDYAGYDSAMYA